MTGTNASGSADRPASSRAPSWDDRDGWSAGSRARPETDSRTSPSVTSQKQYSHHNGPSPHVMRPQNGSSWGPERRAAPPLLPPIGSLTGGDPRYVASPSMARSSMESSISPRLDHQLAGMYHGDGGGGGTSREPEDPTEGDLSSTTTAAALAAVASAAQAYAPHDASDGGYSRGDLPGGVTRKQNSACDACRRRKVRCIRVNDDPTCALCKSKNIECT